RQAKEAQRSKPNLFLRRACRLCQTARPLLCGHRLDDELSLLTGWDSHFGTLQRMTDQRADVGIIQRFRTALQANVAHHIPAPPQLLLRIGQSFTLQEAQRHPTRREHNREDGLTRADARTKSNYQQIVVVVNHLKRPRHKPTKLVKTILAFGADCRFVLPQKYFELLLRRHGGPPSAGSPRLISLPLSQQPIWCLAAAPPELHRPSRSVHTM